MTAGRSDINAEEPTVASMLEENRLRGLERSAKFDPVTGEGSTGRRFVFDVGGLDRQWLPESMRGEKIVSELVAAGSVDAWLRSNGRKRPTQGTRRDVAARLDRLRMLHDFAYWAATRAYIKDKRGGDDVLFRLNRPQRRLVERFESMRTAGRPIRLILLKARQWGGSHNIIYSYI